MLGAAYTALVDGTFPSDPAIRPRFVSNDFHRGKKVMSTLRAELSKCSSFDFSVAFVTRSGITPLLQDLRELELKGIASRQRSITFGLQSEGTQSRITWALYDSAGAAGMYEHFGPSSFYK